MKAPVVTSCTVFNPYSPGPTTRSPTFPGNGFTSALIEVERAIRRSSPGRLADVAAVLGRLARFEIDVAVRATAAAYTDPGLRSVDAIHLATADQLRSSGKAVSGFVTYDSRLAQAASSAGFPAQAPA